MGVVFIAAVGCVACAPVATVSGGAMLNVQPVANIPSAGAYDFDLLGPVRGDACVRSAAASDKPMEYWVGTLPFAGTLPTDSLTAGAIAAASTDAIDRVAGADTLVLTSVVTEGKSPDEVCAYVYGRAVRLKTVWDANALRPSNGKTLDSFDLDPKKVIDCAPILRERYAIPRHAADSVAA